MITFPTILASGVYGSNQTQNGRNIPDDKNRSENVTGDAKSGEKVLGDQIAFRFVGEWGNSCSGDGHFSEPYDVAIDPSSGKGYVADIGNGSVQELDPNGNCISQWQLALSNCPGSRPQGIAANSGNVYVAGSYCERLSKYGPNGTADWPVSGQPMHLAADDAGNSYTSIPDQNIVAKYDKNGKVISQFGTSGSYQFNQPWGVAVDKDGYVYVADVRNYRIVKLDSNGNFIKAWGNEGLGNGQFSSGHSIAVDTSGYVYVLDSTAETGVNRVQVFDSDGNYITQFGSTGSGDGQFYYPCGLAVTPSKHVIIADTNNGRNLEFAPDILIGLEEVKIERPTYNIARIQMSNAAEKDVKIILSNTAGQNVKEAVILKGETRTELDLSNLSNGIYIYSFIYNDKQIYGRIVVQR